MRKAAVATIVLIPLALGVAHADDEPPPVGPQPEPKTTVSLEESFQIENDKGKKKVTHMPAVVFTPDGKTLITGTSNGEIITFDAATRKVLKRVSFSEGEVTALAPGPRGKVLVALESDGRLSVLDAVSGKVRVSTLLAVKKGVTPGKGQGLRSIAVAPDGKTVAIAHGAIIEIRRLSDLALVKKAEGAHSEVCAVAIAPRGERLASVGRDGKLRFFSYPGLEPQREVKKAKPLYAVSFSPDGARVAFGGEELVLHELTIATAEERTIATGQPYWITTCSYSPDGLTVALGDESCDVWVYDVAKAERLFHSKHHVECWLSQVAWSPDSERLLFGCIPNAHAGAPAIYAQNVQLEALKDGQVQRLLKTQESLQDGCFARYAQANDPRSSRVRELLAKRMQLLGGKGGEKEVAAAERAFVTGVAEAASGIALAGLLPANAYLYGTYGADAFFGPVGQGEQEQQFRQIQQPLLDQLASTNQILNRPAGLGLSKEKQKELSSLDAELKQLREKLTARPEVQADLDKLEANRSAQTKAFKKRCEELKKSFCVNEWKIKKAKD